MLSNTALRYLVVIASVLLFLIGQFSCQLCGVTRWKKIALKDVLVEDFMKSANVSSETACAEACAFTPECKSFALSSIYSDQMTCYLYKHRVWNNSSSSMFTGLVYYWLIEKNCPIDRGFEEAFNICAQFLQIPDKTWTTCFKYCEAEGGHLGIVNSRTKLDMFVHINKIGISTYLGARKKGGSFYWIDGSPVNDEYWYPGEPNNHLDNEDTVIIYDKFNGIFDDRSNFVQSCICEIPLM